VTAILAVQQPSLQKVAVLKRYGSKGAKMQTDSFVASGSSPTADFEVQNHGSIFLLIPQTSSAGAWIDEHIGSDNGFQPYYPAVVVEHRYIGAIAEGIVADGLVLA
jgi:hypothetical protein